MDYTTAALDFANIVNFVAVLFLMRAIIIDRKVLRGFSLSGSLLTFVAIFSFEIAYFGMGYFLSFSLGLVSLVFWFLAFAFTLRNKIRERRKNQTVTRDFK